MSQDLEHNLNRTIFAAVSSYIFVSYAQPDDGSWKSETCSWVMPHKCMLCSTNTVVGVVTVVFITQQDESSQDVSDWISDCTVAPKFMYQRIHFCHISHFCCYWCEQSCNLHHLEHHM